MSELDELVKKRTHELNHLLEGLGTDCELDYKQQAQVLEAFAKWAQEQEGE